MTAIFEPLWIGLSPFALVCYALTAALFALSLILRRSTAYWARQVERANAGLDKQPEPWFVRLTIRMHESPILRRLL